jgi:hypothetical protein
MECRYSGPANSYIAKERLVVYKSHPEALRRHMFQPSALRDQGC